MNIYNLTDEDMVKYLLTSDYTDINNPEDFLYLLLRFKNYMRYISSSNENMKSEIALLNNKLNEYSRIIEEKNTEVQVNKDLHDEEYSKLFKRKLTIRERFTGKLKK